ncbi:MAG: hypothetical protein ACXW3S_08565, partial [Rhodoplanes sp.]
MCAVGLELFLRVADFRDLRLVPESYRLPYEHDAELGWIPIAHKVASDTIKINSLGLRDIEVEPTTKPTILVIGDSFVYGAGVKDGERFTDRLRDELPGVSRQCGRRRLRHRPVVSADAAAVAAPRAKRGGSHRVRRQRPSR